METGRICAPRMVNYSSIGMYDKCAPIKCSMVQFLTVWAPYTARNRSRVRLPYGWPNAAIEYSFINADDENVSSVSTTAFATTRAASGRLVRDMVFHPSFDRGNHFPS